MLNNECKFEIGNEVKSTLYDIEGIVSGIRYSEEYGYDIEVDENNEWYPDEWFIKL